MSRPRLVFLSHAMPYSPDSGAAVRSYNILRLLGRHYDVSLLAFTDRPELRLPPSVIDSFNVVSIDLFPVPQVGSRSRLVWDHARSLLLRQVYTRFRYDSSRFASRLSSVLAQTQFDIAHVDSLDLSGYLSALYRIPTVCVHHNIESALLRRRAAAEQSLPRRAYIAIQAALMEKEERTWTARVALNVVVSEMDRRALESSVPGARVTVVPNGVDINTFTIRTAAHEGVVFVGGMTWFPNRDALQYFAREILPILRSNGCSDKVTWVGQALPGAVEAYAAQGITLTGYVDDIRSYVAAAACYIVPLRVGGGTRLKILDAWAMGKAVVSTSVGCEGLDARDGWNILIRDEPSAFAEAVRQVLANESLRTELGANARRTAERIYNWDVIGEAMYAEYEAVRLAGTRSDAGDPATTTVS